MQDGKIGELTRQGKAAAVALAKRLGLPHDEPVILSNRGNLLVQAADGDPVVLHGDAHHGNLLLAPDHRWLWIDLEETGRGPAAWDLATMVSHYSEQEGHERSMRTRPSPERRSPRSPRSGGSAIWRPRCGRCAWRTCTPRATGRWRTDCWRAS